MKVSSRDGKALRRILRAMVTDPVVLSRIASQWPVEGLFGARWANLIGGWCVNYLKRYNKPPNQQIQSIFEEWANSSKQNEKTIATVERFLAYLSTEHEQSKEQSSDYLIDVAGKYFLQVQVRRELLLAEEDVDSGDPEGAYNRLAGMNRVELGVGSMVKPSEDYSVWRHAFDEEQLKPIIQYPNPLDYFIGSAMLRGRLISYMGPDKSGKSYFMLDGAYRAIRSRAKVAYFEVGDLGQIDTLQRFGVRTTRRPMKSGEFQIPISISRDGEVESELRRCRGDLSPSEAFRAFRKICRGRDLFRLSCHPNSSIDIHGITSILSDWERGGWCPDLAVIDYADILAPPRGIRDPLDQIDTTWKMLRRMSQERNCLVITATQSSAAAYKQKEGMLTRAHFSGRKTKLAHVNGMIGINQTPEEKENGVWRLNWVVRRDGGFTENQSIIVAGQLGIASPAIRACY